MARTTMAYMDMAYIVMAYVVMVICSYGLYGASMMNSVPAPMCSYGAIGRLVLAFLSDTITT